MKRAKIMLVADSALLRSPAVVRAAALAIKLDAVVLLCSFEYERALEHAANHSFDLPAYLHARRQRLEEFAETLRKDGATVETELVWGEPVTEQILREVLRQAPALVVKDAAAETTLTRTFFSALDWRLLAQCPVPLMLVRPGARGLPQKVLAAVDPLDEHGKPHELNGEILKTALSLSVQCGASLDVVNAYDLFPLAGAAEYAGWIPDLALYDELRKMHAEALYKLGRQYSIPHAHLHVLSGEASRAITDFASQRQVDLVVMGSIYRTGLKHFLIGSTAEGVFDRVSCDVLVLKPRGFAEELAVIVPPLRATGT